MESSGTNETSEYLYVNIKQIISHSEWKTGSVQGYLRTDQIILVSIRFNSKLGLIYGQVFSFDEEDNDVIYIGVNMFNNAIVFQDDKGLISEINGLSEVQPKNHFTPGKIIQTPQYDERMKLLHRLEKAKNKYLDVLTDIRFDLLDRKPEYVIFDSSEKSFKPIPRTIMISEKDAKLKTEIKKNLSILKKL